MKKKIEIYLFSFVKIKLQKKQGKQKIPLSIYMGKNDETVINCHHVIIAKYI